MKTGLLILALVASHVFIFGVAYWVATWVHQGDPLPEDYEDLDSPENVAFQQSPESKVERP